ncbi:MAG: class I SAM-dependent methyltransferase [Chloroflexi bacterium]|nr:class I SAM-dependent methyltransferase [Chloroflexota bacterium]
MNIPILSTEDFYTAVHRYMQSVDPTWEEDQWRGHQVQEEALLPTILGEAPNCAILDCTCGTGIQAISLARLGWQVTATDITAASLDIARRYSHQMGIHVDFRRCDVRHLESLFPPMFDWVISCMALDNLTLDTELQQACDAILRVLKPGGKCYIRLRDFDTILSARPRYDLKEEHHTVNGRIIRLEDWEYESDAHVICIYVFLQEDLTTTQGHWSTNIFAYRRRALRKVELEGFLRKTGFQDITFLSQPSPWSPYSVIAGRHPE